MRFFEQRVPGLPLYCWWIIKSLYYLGSAEISSCFIIRCEVWGVECGPIFSRDLGIIYNHFGDRNGLFKSSFQVPAFFWRVSFIFHVEKSKVWINKHTQHKNYKSKWTATAHEVPLPWRWPHYRLLEDSNLVLGLSDPHDTSGSFVNMRCCPPADPSVAPSASTITFSLLGLLLRFPHD